MFLIILISLLLCLSVLLFLFYLSLFMFYKLDIWNTYLWHTNHRRISAPSKFSTCGGYHIQFLTAYETWTVLILTLLILQHTRWMHMLLYIEGWGWGIVYIGGHFSHGRSWTINHVLSLPTRDEDVLEKLNYKPPVSSLHNWWPPSQP